MTNLMTFHTKNTTIFLYFLQFFLVNFPFFVLMKFFVYIDCMNWICSNWLTDSQLNNGNERLKLNLKFTEETEWKRNTRLVVGGSVCATSLLNWFFGVFVFHSCFFLGLEFEEYHRTYIKTSRYECWIL